MCPRLELITSAANHALITITPHLGGVGRSQTSGPRDGQSVRGPDGLIFSAGGVSCSDEPQRLTGGNKSGAGQHRKCRERQTRYCRLVFLLSVCARALESQVSMCTTYVTMCVTEHNTIRYTFKDNKMQ